MDINEFAIIIKDMISPYFEDMSSALLTTWIVALIVIIIMDVISNWRLFEKAGYKGWKALIPIYNIVILFKIANVNPNYVILLFIPIINIIAIPVLLVKVYGNISRAFGKSDYYILGLVFLNTLFTVLLSFGNSEYSSKKEVKKVKEIKEEKESNKVLDVKEEKPVRKTATKTASKKTTSVKKSTTTNKASSTKSTRSTKTAPKKTTTKTVSKKSTK